MCENKRALLLQGYSPLFRLTYFRFANSVSPHKLDLGREFVPETQISIPVDVPKQSSVGSNCNPHLDLQSHLPI